MEYKYRGTFENLQKIILDAGHAILDAKSLEHIRSKPTMEVASIGLKQQERFKFKATKS